MTFFWTYLCEHGFVEACSKLLVEKVSFLSPLLCTTEVTFLVGCFRLQSIDSCCLGVWYWLSRIHTINKQLMSLWANVYQNLILLINLILIKGLQLQVWLMDRNLPTFLLCPLAWLQPISHICFWMHSNQTLFKWQASLREVSTQSINSSNDQRLTFPILMISTIGRMFSITKILCYYPFSRLSLKRTFDCLWLDCLRLTIDLYASQAFANYVNMFVWSILLFNHRSFRFLHLDRLLNVRGRYCVVGGSNTPVRFIWSVYDDWKEILILYI